MKPASQPTNQLSSSPHDTRTNDVDYQRREVIEDGGVHWRWEGVGIGGAARMDNIWEERKKASKQPGYIYTKGSSLSHVYGREGTCLPTLPT